MIHFCGVSKIYKDFSILKDFNLEIKPSETYLLHGRSGVGKTTILKLVYIEELPTSGQVFIMGKDTSGLTYIEKMLLRRRIGVVMEDLPLLECRDVFENIALPCYILNQAYSEVYLKVMRVLNKVDLIPKRHLTPDKLSQEERYKAIFARAIVNSPSILLIDEPRCEEYGSWLIVLLKELMAMGTTMIITSKSTELVNLIPGIFMVKL